MLRVRAVLGLGLGAALVVSAVAVPSGAAAAHRLPIPWSVGQFQYLDKPACHRDTTHHLARVWWTESSVPGRLPGADGSCASVPHIAELALGSVEGFIRSEHRLGLPRQHSDRGMHEPDIFSGQDLLIDGGSAAVDVYLGGTAGGGGVSECITGGNTSAAYVAIGTPADNGAESDPVYRTVLAHELVHVGQCQVHDGHGHTGTDPSDWIVEGTANMIAASVLRSELGTPDVAFGDSPTLDDGPSRAVTRSPLRTFGVRSSNPLDDRTYDTWPFWYALTHGKVSAKLLALFRRAAADPSGHKSGDVAALRHVFSPNALQRALMAMARFDGFGQGLTGVAIPYDDWWHWRTSLVPGDPSQRLDDVSAAESRSKLTVPPGGAAWVRIRPADPTNAVLAVDVSPADATARALATSGVLVVDQFARTVTPSSPGSWSVPVWPPPTFQVPTGASTTVPEQGDSEAWVLLANSHKTAATFVVSASSHAG